MFGDHTYLSGVTRSLSEHFRGVAAEVDRRLAGVTRRKAVLDIGSNDGTQLHHFQELGYDVLGVESSKTTARLAVEAGVPTLNEFFNRETAARIGRKFDAINAAGVFFHLEELHSVTDGIRAGLADDGAVRRPVPLHEADRRKPGLRPDLSRTFAVLQLEEHRNPAEPPRPGPVRRLPGADPRRLDDRLREPPGHAAAERRLAATRAARKRPQAPTTSAPTTSSPGASRT